MVTGVLSERAKRRLRLAASAAGTARSSKVARRCVCGGVPPPRAALAASAALVMAGALVAACGGSGGSAESGAHEAQAGGTAAESGAPATSGRDDAGARTAAAGGTGPSTGGRAAWPPAQYGLIDLSAAPKPKCPARAPAPPSGPTVAGLALEMPLEVALERMRCAMPDAEYVALQERWLPPLRVPANVQLGPQAFTLQRGDTADCGPWKPNDPNRCGVGKRVWKHIAESVRVAAPGLPGREAVAAIWHTRAWKPEEMPTRDAVLADLRARYGQEQRQRARGVLLELTWSHDPDGQPVPASVLDAGECGAVQANWGAPQRFAEGCGTTIVAALNPAPGDAARVQSLTIAFVHEERLVAIGEEMQRAIDSGSLVAGGPR